MDELRVADAMTEVFTIFTQHAQIHRLNNAMGTCTDEEKKDRLATVLYNLVQRICIGANPAEFL
jgi:hypothetical protein